MKQRIFSILVTIIFLFVCGCSDSTSPSEKESEIVHFHGETFSYDTVNVEISSPVDGPQLYSLTVELFSGFARLRVQVECNEEHPSSLLTPGEHEPSDPEGGSIYWDMSSPRLQFSNLSGDQISIVWESTEFEDNHLTGRGYLHFKERVYYTCADSIYSSFGAYGQGDPEYENYFNHYCEPGFYFENQKVLFEVVDEEVSW